MIWPLLTGMYLSPYSSKPCCDHIQCGIGVRCLFPLTVKLFVNFYGGNDTLWIHISTQGETTKPFSTSPERSSGVEVCLFALSPGIRFMWHSASDFPQSLSHNTISPFSSLSQSWMLAVVCTFLSEQIAVCRPCLFILHLDGSKAHGPCRKCPCYLDAGALPLLCSLCWSEMFQFWQVREPSRNGAGADDERSPGRSFRRLHPHRSTVHHLTMASMTSNPPCTLGAVSEPNVLPRAWSGSDRSVHAQIKHNKIHHQHNQTIFLKAPFKAKNDKCETVAMCQSNTTPT